MHAQSHSKYLKVSQSWIGSELTLDGRPMASLREEAHCWVSMSQTFPTSVGPSLSSLSCFYMLCRCASTCAHLGLTEFCCIFCFLRANLDPETVSSPVPRCALLRSTLENLGMYSVFTATRFTRSTIRTAFLDILGMIVFRLLAFGRMSRHWQRSTTSPLLCRAKMIQRSCVVLVSLNYLRANAPLPPTPE